MLKIDLNEYKEAPFVEFLEKEFKITGVLRDMILYNRSPNISIVRYSICLAGSESTVLGDRHGISFLS